MLIRQDYNSLDTDYEFRLHVGQAPSKVRKSMQPVKIVMMIAAVIWGVSAAGAAEQPDTIKKTIDSSISVRSETQKKAADWQTKKERMKGRYYQLKDAVEAGKLEVKHMQDVVSRQDVYIQRMQNRIVEMEKIRQNLVPYLEEVLVRIEKTVEQDLPFLLEERRTRISALKQLIHDPELTMGEKMRRVFEGLRVEMDYGKSVETTKEEISFDGQKLMVRVLRLGRTALMMQTLDQSEVGIFHNGEWIPLAGKYREEIKKAIEITERRRPIEFVNLPVKGMVQ